MKKRKMRRTAHRLLMREMDYTCRMMPGLFPHMRSAMERHLLRRSCCERAQAHIDMMWDIGMMTKASADRFTRLLRWHTWDCPQAIKDRQATLRAIMEER
jgi:hypothetical protein